MAFIVIEGPDGVGKTTQAKLLCRHFEQIGRKHLYVREPGGTIAGERIRAILLDKDVGLTRRAQLFLFNAARAELCESVIGPALASGAIVVADRFYLSTLVYQTVGDDAIEYTTACQVTRSAVPFGCYPEHTIILSVPFMVSTARRRRGERFKEESDQIRAHICNRYEMYGRRESRCGLFEEQITLIDADAPEAAVHARILEAVMPAL